MNQGDQEENDVTGAGPPADETRPDGGPPEELELIDEEHLDEKEKKLNKLKRELDSCRKDKEEYLAGWQRAKADYINYKKDEERRAEDFIKFANTGILRELLDVADSIEKAAMLSDNHGIKNIYAQMLGIFEKFGVKKIDSAGQLFDPARHESVAETQAPDRESDNKILEELQAGYTMHDRVLRPARVKVGIYKKESND